MKTIQKAVLKTLGLLFLLSISSSAFTQHKTIQQVINWLSEAKFGTMPTPAFVPSYNYNFKTDKDFYDDLTVKLHMSKSLAKEVIKGVDKNNWPEWIKNGVGAENEKHFTSLVGVQIPYISFYYSQMFAFLPENNDHLPVGLRFEKPFYVVARPYQFEYFDLLKDDGSTLNSFNFGKWTEELGKKFHFKKPFRFQATSNFFNTFGQLAQAEDGIYFEPLSIRLFDAFMLCKGTGINPEWLTTFSLYNNFPTNLSNLTASQINSLKAYRIYSRVEGYDYSVRQNTHSVIKTSFIWIPANENMHLKNELWLSSGKDLFLVVKGYYPVSHPYIQEDRLDTTRFETFATNATILTRTSPAGRIADLIRDCPNKFVNISPKEPWQDLNKEFLKKSIHWSDAISYTTGDYMLKAKETGRVTYIVELIDNLDLGIAKKYAEEFGYRYLNRIDFFDGIKGFSKIRQPRLRVFGDKMYSGADINKNGAAYIASIRVDGTSNYESEYEYNQELANYYQSYLRGQIKVYPSLKFPGKYGVLFALGNIQ